MKGATIYENDNPFFISTKQQLHFFSLAVTWLSWLDKASMTLLVLYCLLYISCTNIYKNKPSFNTLYKELRIKSCMLTRQSLITSCKTNNSKRKGQRSSTSPVTLVMISSHTPEIFVIIKFARSFYWPLVILGDLRSGDSRPIICHGKK